MKTAITSTLFLLTIAGAFSWSSENVSRREVASATASKLIGGTASASASASYLAFLGGSALPSPADAAEAAEDADDYITTSRGLKYKVVTPPTDPDSPLPLRAQKVKAKYTLYLNGFPEDTESSKKIDSSKGLLGEKPFEFLAGVSQVIKGWDLSIMEMRVGEARKLVIPSALGYGEKGAGGKIPGGATLYFDVELAEIGARAKIGEDQVKWLEDNPL